MITTHILDLSRGRPASNVAVKLFHSQAGAYVLLGSGTTDDDGRLRTLLPESHKLEVGVYKLEFETAPYFQTQGVVGFYPEVTVVFNVEAGREHYHVPLLLSPFGYSTYRGS